MEKVHRQILQKNHTYLIEEIALDELLDALFSRTIFNDHMMRDIKSQPSSIAQTRTMLTRLRQRGPKAYPAFIEALNETDQQHIAERLTQDLMHHHATVVTTAAHSCSQTAAAQSTRKAAQTQPETSTIREEWNHNVQSASHQHSQNADSHSTTQQDLNARYAEPRHKPYEPINNSYHHSPADNISASAQGPGPIRRRHIVNQMRRTHPLASHSFRNGVTSSGRPENSARSNPDLHSPDTTEHVDYMSGPGAVHPHVTIPGTSNLTSENVQLDADNLARMYSLLQQDILQKQAMQAGQSKEPEPMVSLSPDESSDIQVPTSTSNQSDPEYVQLPTNEKTALTFSEPIRLLLNDPMDGTLAPTPGFEGVKLAARERTATPPTTVSLTSTDNPHSEIEIYQTGDDRQHVDNSYPEQFGIPETSGILDYDLSQSGAFIHSNVANHSSDTYPMNTDPRGFCLIINNRHFTGHLKERLGTDVDRDNLYNLFSNFGYKICTLENLPALHMLEALQNFAQMREHAGVDSCVVVLLTHGLDGKVYGTDAQLLNLSEVFSFFDGDKCPGLAGKPKFFIIQACRGEKYDNGFDVTDNGETDMPGDIMYDMQKQQITDITHLNKKLPSMSDFLISYATVPGFVSWRNSEQGSWFVQALCETFIHKFQTDDVLNMLVQVNNKVATVYESATKHKQLPSPVVHLLKKLYFTPLFGVH